MRVSMKYGSYPLPCETFSFGEAEDYTVNFSLDALAEETAETHSAISVYPNPTSNFLTVETGDEQSEAFIYSMNGTLLKHLVIMDKEIIDLQKFPIGIYLIRILSNGYVYYEERIIKQ
jgi:hypothetical protein